MKTPDQIIGPGLDKFYQLRPNAFKHLNLREGKYWHVFAAQRACVALALQHVVRLRATNSLTATGQDLIDYVNSEFTPIASEDLAGTTAVGEIYLTRSATLSNGDPNPLVTGDIPRGTRFVRQANTTTQIPVQAATYQTTADYHFVQGQLVSGSIPIEATVSGSVANHPERLDLIDPKVSVSGSALFDPTITVSYFASGGGSDPFGSTVNFSPNDSDAANQFIRDFAQASGRGQYGPNADAALYGAIRGTGGRRVISYDDITRGVLKLLVADSSWGGSLLWSNRVQQSLYDNKLVGFGCAVEVSRVRNKVASASANVVLRDWNYTTEPTEIDDAIREAVQSYFDDRLDWSTYRNHALKNTVTSAHPKILKCDSITVFDVSGNPMSDVSFDSSIEQFHFYVARKAVSCSYIGPG